MYCLPISDEVKLFSYLGSKTFIFRDRSIANFSARSGVPVQCFKKMVVSPCFRCMQKIKKPMDRAYNSASISSMPVHRQIELSQNYSKMFEPSLV